jgi:hypothetical protein
MSLELGTGTAAFSPLTLGDPLTMVHDLVNGTWYVEIAAIVGHSENKVTAVTSIGSTDLGVVGGLQTIDPPLDLEPGAEACGGVFTNYQVPIDTDRATGPTGQDFVCSLAGAEVTLSMNVADLGSPKTAAAQIDVTLALDPADVPNCP